MTALRVLLIDDDSGSAAGASRGSQIRMTGVTVDTAESAAAALDQIALEEYDAVISDIKTPGMDGLALLAEIRTRRPDTPILMIVDGARPWRA